MSGDAQNLIVQESREISLVCDPDFEYFKQGLVNLKKEFLKDGYVLHNARNVLKKFTSDDFPELKSSIVVKSFKVPHLLNRVVYTFFRKSKARRSFENSQLVLAAGFLVPKPLAFIEYRESGLLKESFFISENIEFDGTLSQVKKQKLFEWDEVLPLVVEQACKLCEKNILHKDFSPGNILVKHAENKFQFYFVDLNRLKYGEISKKQSLLNLLRLAHDERSVSLVIESFCNVSGMEHKKANSIFRSAFDRRNTKNKIKKKIKRR